MSYVRYTNHRCGNRGYPFVAYGTKEMFGCEELTEFPLYSAAVTHNQTPGPFRQVRSEAEMLSLANVGTLPNYSFLVNEDPVPDPVVTEHYNVRITTKSKNRDFARRRKSGDIVLQPMSILQVSSTSYPGYPDATLIRTRESGQLRDISGWKTTTEIRGRWCGINNIAYRVVQPMTGTLDFDPWYWSGRTAALDPSWFRRYQEYRTNGSAVLPTHHASAAVSRMVAAWSKEGMKTGLITEARASANAGILDLMTELGEAKETLSFVMSLLRNVFTLYRNTRNAVANVSRSPGKSASAIADEVSSLWLQFRYAVMPMAYTVQDTLEYLSTDFAPYQTFRSGERVSVNLDFDDWVASSDLEIIHRVFLKHKYSLDTKFHNLGMNPFATAWELTPLSFVIDWFVNIGDLIVSLGVPSNVSKEAAQYSWQVKPSVITFTRGAERFDVHFGGYRVNPINISAHVGLDLDVNMSWKRWADALALTWSMSKSLLKG